MLQEYRIWTDRDLGVGKITRHFSIYEKRKKIPTSDFSWIKFVISEMIKLVLRTKHTQTRHLV